MSNMSYTFKENSQVKDIQGGEKKVMKKILSVALSTAMAFSMFASVAFGAESLTPQQQFDALKAKGILTGYADGSAHLEKTITRAELAKVIVGTMSLKPIEGVYSFNDKNYKKDAKWPAPYIEAVAAAGIMQGDNKAKKIFNFNGNVTVEELATVLVRALKLPEVPADKIDNDASAWAKGFVQAAINAGYIEKGINYKAAATRSQVVVAAYTIDQQKSIPTVASYKVVDANNVEFTLSNQEVVKVKLDKALEANKETAVEFKDSKGNTIATKVTWVVTSATKVTGVSADNLREVKVAFDGEVDQTTAEDAGNYDITSDTQQAVTVLSAALSSDKKTVTLTVKRTSDSTNTIGLDNQKEYKLTANNIRAGGAVISTSNFKFTPVDAALPVANSAQALGNKAIKITFSEPVSAATANNFLIDGQAVVGTTNIAGNTVVLKLYSTLTNAEHTVTVRDVTDFSGLKNVTTDLKFSVVEDKQAPTIAKVEKATFEKVTLKFSESVDPSTVNASSVYWLQGSDKKYASDVRAISDDTYEFSFSSANRVLYTTDLYVTGVADYSGNIVAADTKISVSPTVDQTRPEVVSAKFAENSKTVLNIKFTKSLLESSVKKSDNYVIKDADNKEVSKFKDAKLLSDGKTVQVTLYEALTEGKTYTLTVSNVSDNTTLTNVMVPYSTTIKVGDVTPPTVESANYASGNRVVINYSEPVATSGDGSALDLSKYIYYAGGTVSADGKDVNGGTWKSLPSGTNPTISSDGKSVVLVFPSSVVVGDAATGVKGIRVTGIKDLAGNTISGLVQQVQVANEQALNVDATTPVKATATNKVEVLFNQAIQSASPSDFVVENTAGDRLSVTTVSVDGKKAVLTLSDSTKLDTNGTYNKKALKVTVNANRNLVTPTGAKLQSDAVVTNIADAIKPAISEVDKTVENYKFNVNFTEDIVLGTNGVYDFEVLVDGKTLQQQTGTTASDNGFVVAKTGDSVVTVTLSNTVVANNKGKVVQVRIKPYPSFITDAATPANTVAGNDNFYSSLIPDAADTTAPAAPDATKLKITDNDTTAVDTIAGDAGAVEANAVVKVYSDAALTNLVGTKTAAADGSFAAINLTDASTGSITYYVTATDASGNVSAATSKAYTAAK